MDGIFINIPAFALCNVVSLYILFEYWMVPSLAEFKKDGGANGKQEDHQQAQYPAHRLMQAGQQQEGRGGPSGGQPLWAPVLADHCNQQMRHTRPIPELSLNTVVQAMKARARTVPCL